MRLSGELGPVRAAGQAIYLMKPNAGRSPSHTAGAESGQYVKRWPTVHDLGLRTQISVRGVSCMMPDRLAPRTLVHPARIWYP